MDAVLFHPETSERRALILTLGAYGREGLSAGERDALAARLLAVYRDDPDAGVHGAAAWTLRQWGLKDKLATLDAELVRLKDPGGRRWYVNGQGQTFAVIAGPVEFRRGAPADEPDRANSLPTAWMTIPRRFAIAATEVTSSQFQKFLETSSARSDSWSWPGPEYPRTNVNWYEAAHYCNWLSEQEGLPRDQWCYIPAQTGGYADGMTVPADVLLRTGYRLPTEAEWEYACRSGTITSRYYGAEAELLGLYARYTANNGGDHTSPCGGLLPNDLGLFDMLGNAYEWMHDRNGLTRPGRHARYNDTINTLESIDPTPRFVRGGAFYDKTKCVRAAYRDSNPPSFHFVSYGFRLARTCP